MSIVTTMKTMLSQRAAQMSLETESETQRVRLGDILRCESLINHGGGEQRLHGLSWEGQGVATHREG